MKVTLTGATGFVESHVLRELQQHGHAEARARLGDYLAEVLLLDQSADAARARAELDWRPSHPGLVEDFRHGSYRTWPSRAASPMPRDNPAVPDRA